MCVSLQRRAIPHFKIHVLLQRRTQKCMNQAQEARGNTRHTKITILPKFRTSDQHEVTRGLRERASKFAFHLSFGRPISTKRREGCETTQADSHFTSVLDVRWARNDERVATTRYKIRISPQFWTSDEHETTRGLRRRRTKFAFHLSFGRPMSTKRREGSTTRYKIRISPQFWTSDEHETTRGFNDDIQNSHFTTVLDVRWARSDERVVSRLDRPNPPCVKKKEILKKSWSTTILSRSSEQIFSADLLSRSSQQIFFSRSSQQIFFSRSSQQIFSADFLSADFLSRSSQQIFSADFLQQIFSADLLSRFSLSRSSQQIFSADFLSRSSQQIFSADLLIVLSFAVVRGWWSAIVLSFLSFAVVRGWWSAIVLSCWWSILHEFFRRTLSRSFREKSAQGLYYINIPLFWLPILKNLGAELITEILTTFARWESFKNESPLKTRESFKNKVMFFLHGAIHQHLSGQIQQNSNSPTRCDFVGFISKYQLHMKSRHLLDYLTLRTPCKWGRICSIPYPMICDNRIFKSTHFTLSGWWMSGSIEQCWRFVINFGLQWSLCQAKIVNRKCLICKQRGAGNIKRMTKKKGCWCKSLGTCFLELRKISATNLNHQHLHSHPHNDPMPQDPQEVSRPILVRGHGPYCPAHPRPPWPPGAAQRPNRGLRGLPSAAVCSLGSRGPSPSRRQNPTKRRGEELWENLGTSKVEVLEIVATQNSLMRCLEDIELVFKKCCL